MEKIHRVDNTEERVIDVPPEIVPPGIADMLRNLHTTMIETLPVDLHKELINRIDRMHKKFTRLTCATNHDNIFESLKSTTSVYGKFWKWQIRQYSRDWLFILGVMML